MDAQTIIGLVLSSTVIGGVISSVFTRKTAKESNDIDLLDRAYKEIERLDKQLTDRDTLIREQADRIAELERERFYVKQ